MQLQNHFQYYFIDNGFVILNNMRNSQEHNDITVQGQISFQQRSLKSFKGISLTEIIMNRERGTSLGMQ